MRAIIKQLPTAAQIGSRSKQKHITSIDETAMMMLASRTAAFGAALSQCRSAAPSLIVRGMADIAVEHGRGQWKTYGELSSYKPGKFQIKCFNKISPVGLARFPEDVYDVRTDGEDAPNAHAILLRSHKLQEEEVAHTVRAIARCVYAVVIKVWHSPVAHPRSLLYRCGAGTNNIPVPRMTELGIPVFNTPGANANAVKELVICGMLLGSRRIVDGINHMTSLGEQGLARERVEKDKAMFGGQELEGKTLAVIGLGASVLAKARKE